MATTKKPEVNLSEKVREYLKSVKPSDRGPAAVAKALQAKGFEVSPNLVSLQKSKLGMTQKKRKKTMKAKAKARKPAHATNNGHHDLLIAKSFITATGGIEKAQNLLDVLAKILS